MEKGLLLLLLYLVLSAILIVLFNGYIGTTLWVVLLMGSVIVGGISGYIDGKKL